MSDDVSFSLRAPPAPASDSPVDEVKPRGVGEDVFDIGSLSFNPFGDPATTPSTTPTGSAGTTPAASGDKPLLSPAQAGALGDAVLGGVEDLAHQFGIGPGSAATQAREQAAAQAKLQQNLVIGAVVVVVVGVGLFLLLRPSAPAAAAAT